MSLQGIRQPTKDTLNNHIEGVRLFMRDFAGLNLLIQGEESSDRMLAFATMTFLSDFNGTPPFSGLSLDDMYARHLAALAIRGTTIIVLQSLMIIYNRNHLPFSDGGMSVAINDKAPMIQAILQVLQSAYEQNKRTTKTALNIEQLLDGTAPNGLHSDYYAMSAMGY